MCPSFVGEFIWLWSKSIICPSYVNSQFLCHFEITNIEFKETLQKLKRDSEFDNMNKSFKNYSCNFAADLHSTIHCAYWFILEKFVNLTLICIFKSLNFRRNSSACLVSSKINSFLWSFKFSFFIWSTKNFNSCDYFVFNYWMFIGFPNGSGGEQPTCNAGEAGDAGSTSGL